MHMYISKYSVNVYVLSMLQTCVYMGCAYVHIYICVNVFVYVYISLSMYLSIYISLYINIHMLS